LKNFHAKFKVLNTYHIKFLRFFYLPIYFTFMENNLMIRRFQGRISDDIHRDFVPVFQINQLMPFIIQKIMGYIKGKTTFYPTNHLATGAGLHPAQIKEGQGLH